MSLLQVTISVSIIPSPVTVVSFEAVQKPKHFARDSNSLLDLQKATFGYPLTIKRDAIDATFLRRDDWFYPGFTAFESSKREGFFKEFWNLCDT